jgi:hypothetical protein
MVSPVILKKVEPTMTFPEAMAEVIKGAKVTRLEWQNNGVYGVLKDGLLQIRMDGQLKRWIVSDGDLLNNDWCVVTEAN